MELEEHARRRLVALLPRQVRGPQILRVAFLARRPVFQQQTHAGLGAIARRRVERRVAPRVREVHHAVRAVACAGTDRSYSAETESRRRRGFDVDIPCGHTSDAALGQSGLERRRSFDGAFGTAVRAKNILS